MSVWLTAVQATAAANVLLLAGLLSVWVRNYLDHGAAHTLGLLVFGGFLLVENAVWIYLYVVNRTFVEAFPGLPTAIQAGVTALCGLEFIALLALARITWW